MLSKVIINGNFSDDEFSNYLILSKQNILTFFQIKFTVSWKIN